MEDSPLTVLEISMNAAAAIARHTTGHWSKTSTTGQDIGEEPAHHSLRGAARERSVRIRRPAAVV